MKSSKQNTLNHVVEILKERYSDCCGIVIGGSTIAGQISRYSDIDAIVFMQDSIEYAKDSFSIKKKLYDVHIFNFDKFISNIVNQIYNEKIQFLKLFTCGIVVYDKYSKLKKFQRKLLGFEKDFSARIRKNSSYLNYKIANSYQDYIATENQVEALFELVTLINRLIGLKILKTGELPESNPSRWSVRRIKEIDRKFYDLLELVFSKHNQKDKVEVIGKILKTCNLTNIYQRSLFKTFDQKDAINMRSWLEVDISMKYNRCKAHLLINCLAIILTKLKVQISKVFYRFDQNKISLFVPLAYLTNENGLKKQLLISLQKEVLIKKHDLQLESLCYKTNNSVSITHGGYSASVLVENCCAVISNTLIKLGSKSETGYSSSVLSIELAILSLAVARKIVPYHSLKEFFEYCFKRESNLGIYSTNDKIVQDQRTIYKSYNNKLVALKKQSKTFSGKQLIIKNETTFKSLISILQTEAIKLNKLALENSLLTHFGQESKNRIYWNPLYRILNHLGNNFRLLGNSDPKLAYYALFNNYFSNNRS